MCKMNFEGVSKERIQKELQGAKEENLDLGRSRVLGSMCTVPHPIAVEAHMGFIDSNLGNPGLCRGTGRLEREVLRMVGGLVNLEDPSGHFLSGATEANITAMFMARSRGKRKVIYPVSAHFSVEKAVKLMELEPVRIGLDDGYRMDLGELEDAVDDGTAIIFSVAGTTELGAVDPVDRIVSIANGIPVHVDAAFGGFVLPFLDQEQVRKRAGVWDFRNEGVTSMAADPHKMGLSTIPGGCLLYRDLEGFAHLGVDSPYLTTPVSYTLSGTRASGAVAGAYAVMRYLGREGYGSIVRRCMENTSRLKEGLVRLSMEPIIDPLMNILAVHHPEPERVKGALEMEGWYISTVREPSGLRFVIMPHVTSEAIDELIDVMERAL